MSKQKMSVLSFFKKVLGLKNGKKKNVKAVESSTAKSDFIPMSERGGYLTRSEEPFTGLEWEPDFDRKRGELSGFDSDPSDSW